eukprot:g6723.t1
MTSLPLLRMRRRRCFWSPRLPQPRSKSCHCQTASTRLSRAVRQEQMRTELARWQYSTLTSTISQASQDPLIPNTLAVNVIQCAIEVLLIFDCAAHYYASQGFKVWAKSPYNAIDILAIAPLPLRFAVGVTTPTMEENPVAHYVLVCFVPLIRMLKLVRRFQKLQLLLHVLSTVIDALKLLLFMRLKNWGVSAGDMPRLFKKFDSDGNGELGMDEFVETFLKMP